MKIKTIIINFMCIILSVTTVLSISKSNLKSKNTEKTEIIINKIVEKENINNNMQVKYTKLFFPY